MATNTESAEVVAPPQPKPVPVPPPNALAFVGKYPSENISGHSIFDAPDLKATILAMPNGKNIWREVLQRREGLSVEMPIEIQNPGRYQKLVINLCEAHNCGGASAGQLLIEYFPDQDPKARQAFICINYGNRLAVYDPAGPGFMDGEECTKDGFFYGD